MSLQKRPIDVPISGGKGENVHPFVAVPPTNAEVYDARFLHDGAIAKRHGVETLPGLDGLTAHSDDEGGVHSIAVQDGRVIAITHDGTFAHDEVDGSWVAMGRQGPRPSQARTDALIRGNNSLRHADMAVATVSGKTLALVVWHDLGEDAVFYSFFELPSDGRPAVQVSRPAEVAGGMTRFPKCAVVGTRFAIVGTDGTQSAVYGTSVDAAGSYVMPAASSIHTSCNAIQSSTLEFFSNATHFWIVCGHNTSTVLYRRDSSFLASSNRSFATALPMAAALVGSNVVVAHFNGTVSRLASDLSAAETTAGPFLTPQATTRVHCGTVVQADATGRYYVAWSGDGCHIPDGGGIGNFGLDIAYFSSVHTGISQTALGGVRLGGRAVWDESTASPLFPLINRQSNLPGAENHGIGVVPLAQYYVGHIARPVLSDADGSAFLRMAPVCAYGTDTADIYQAYWSTDPFIAGMIRNHLPSMRAVSAGSFVFPFHVLTSIATGNARRQIDLLRLETVGSGSLRSVESQGVRVTSGGMVASIDGATSAELQPPPPVYVDETTWDTDYDYGVSDPRPAGAGGGQVPASFAIRWTDSEGNLHRSFVAEPNAFRWVVLDSGHWYARRWIIPRPWPVALAQGSAPLQYQVEVYQSGGDGAALGDDRYLMAIATPKAHPTLTACDYIVPVFASVATGAAHEALIVNNTSTVFGEDGYTRCWQDTSPAEYVPIPPPPMIDICSTQSRVWGLSAEKGRLEVWPSKLLVEGYAPEFAPDLVVRVPAEGGECVGIAALDDKVVVFKERSIFVLFGDPGTNTGTRSTLQTPRLVSGDVGCSNPRSIVEGPFGVAFQAASDDGSANGGIHVIDRGLAVTFAGAPVKDTVAGVELESAVLVPAEKEVRWVAPDASCIVWNYGLNRWHIHTDKARHSAALRRGRFAALESSTSIVVDRPTWDTTLDDFGAQVVTSWIKLSSLQGFQRLWLCMILLRWRTGALRVEYAIDYDDEWSNAELREYSSAQLAALSATGRVQVVFKPVRQKCESFRLRFTELADPFFVGQTEFSRAGQGMEIVGLTLEAGVKRGSFRRGTSTTDRTK